MTSVLELAQSAALCRVCHAPQQLTAGGNVRTHRDADGVAKCAGSCRRPQASVLTEVVEEPSAVDEAWFGFCPRCKEPQRVASDSKLADHFDGASHCRGSRTLVGRWLPVATGEEADADELGICAFCDQVQELDPRGQVVDHWTWGRSCSGSRVLPFETVALVTALPVAPTVPQPRAAGSSEHVAAAAPVALEPKPTRKSRGGKVLVGLLLVLAVGGWLLHAKASSTSASSYSSSTSSEDYSYTDSSTSDYSSSSVDSGEVGDAVFVTVVRGSAEGVSGDSDATIIELGHQICSLLRDGISVRSLSLALLSHGISGRNVGVFVGAATPAYCPEQNDNARAFFNSVG